MVRTLLLSAVFGGFTLAAEAATIVNGSFEGPVAVGSFQTLTGSDLTGWTIGAGTSVDLVGSYWQASEGDQSLDLSGTGTGASGGRISQTVTDLILGATYHLLFDYAANPDILGPATKKMFVTLGSSPGVVSTWTFSRTGHSHSDMGWVTGDISFVATATSMLLGFRNGEGSEAGMALDNVRLTGGPLPAAVPLPASGLLLAGGLAALGLGRRRR